MNISIFGLGYVGTVTAVCLSKYGHTVTGVDTNEFKVSCLQRGISPIVEPGVEGLLKDAHDHRRLSATTSAEEAVKQTDVSLVCVGTPSNSNGSLNLEYVTRVAEQLGHALRRKNGYHGVAIRSTVLPGTVERLVALMQSASGKKMGEGFGIASNPEFLREGSSLFDFENPPYTIVGTSDQRMVELLQEMYRSINSPFHVVRIREAEFLKYACNAFHAVKVTFANEVGVLCKGWGIDSHAVMKIFCDDAKLNISPAYLKPGFAFGGSCLPKDVRALTHEAQAMDVATPLLASLLPSNEFQIQRVVDWVVRQKKKNIGVLGLSFKSNTDDMRESPIVTVVETLLGKGYVIAIYDSNVNLSRLLGTNLSYIEQEIPHISLLLKATAQEVLDHAEVLIVANKGEDFKGILSSLGRGKPVLDLVRVSEHVSPDIRYEGITW